MKLRPRLFLATTVFVFLALARPVAAKDAWQKTLAFLAAHLEH